MALGKARRWISGALGSKPRTVVALLVAVVVTLLGWYWPWGLLFLYWAALSVRDGDAFLIERISKAGNPALFWSITALWTTFGLWILYVEIQTRLA